MSAVSEKARPEETKFLQRCARESREGLVDFKFYKGNITTESTTESFFGQLNGALDAVDRGDVHGSIHCTPEGEVTIKRA